MTDRGRVAVSVVVATYNRAPVLRGALASLETQRVPVGLTWEIVVVDNNSRDTTAAVVQEFAARAPVPVSYVYEPRQGKSRALNRGVALARGEITAFIDDDVRPACDWVALAGTVLDAWTADGAGGRMLPLWQEPPPPWLVGNLALCGRLGVLEHPHPVVLALPVTYPAVWGGNMVLRRSVLQALGGFDVELGPVGSRRHCGEDLDVVRRLLDAGCRVVYDPTLTVWHQVPRSRMRRRYVLRAEWDDGAGAGLASVAPDGPRLWGAARWRYRVAARLLIRWLADTLRRSPGLFEDGREIAYELGVLWGHYQRSRRSPDGDQSAASHRVSRTQAKRSRSATPGRVS